MVPKRVGRAGPGAGIWWEKSTEAPATGPSSTPFAGFAEQVAHLVQQTWGRDAFDILVHNAGAMASTPLGATETTAVQQMVLVHLTGVVFLTQPLLPLLADGGRIITTSTGLARSTGDFDYSVYASMKGAVEVHTRYLAKELGARRIAVNTIAPGATGTDLGGGAIRDNDDVRTHLGSLVAMGRVGDPDDIGSPVAALASDGMAWVTGQRVEASGGMSL